MIRKLMIPTLLTLCGNSYAHDCGGINENFRIIYDVSSHSHEKVHIKNKQNPEVLNKVITIGYEFKERKNRHHNVIYTLNSIKGNKAQFGYIYKYDARSVGGSFEKCSGVVTIGL